MSRFEDIIALGLRLGVSLSILFILIGLLLLYAYTPSCIDFSNFTTRGISVIGILYGLPRLDGMSFILLGIVVLIATPVFRVLLSVFHFAEEKDWLYVAITLIVLIDLLIALLVIPSLVAG